MASAGLGLDGTHAARYGASEILKDRHPDLSPAFPDHVIPEEIAVAFGRRHVPKLVDVIALPDGQIPYDQLATALRYLLSLLSNQETKTETVTYGAAPFLVDHLKCEDAYVRCLAGQTLSSLAQLLLGRAAIVEAKGIPAVTALLKDSNKDARCAAAECLAMLSSGPEGAAAVLACASGVLQKQKVMLEDPETSPEGLLAAVLTLVHTTTNDMGIYQALDAHVPATLLRMASSDTSTEDLRAACGRALRNLAHHPYGKVQVIEAGGISAMATLLMSDDEILQQHGCGCLMGLTLEEEAKLATIQECGDMLAELIHHPNPDVAENALATLQNCCEHPTARELVENMLDDEDMDYVFML